VTWVNIIGTDIPSHFHLIGTYLSAPQEQRNKFQVWGNDQQPWLTKAPLSNQGCYGYQTGILAFLSWKPFQLCSNDSGFVLGWSCPLDV
jgi:hypothetical protein